jgi:tRNA U34 2-thiouridine synthase MnmA/TrmU
VITLETPVVGVAPGQTAAVYRDDHIVAAGTIAGSSS